MYHVPARPEYLGRYHWRTVIAGLAAMVLFSWICTQLAADHYRYQAALGRPLVRIGLLAIYQPYAWVVWLFRFGNSVDDALFLYAGAAVVGSAIVVFAAALHNMHRTRNLANNLDALHGSARWATPKEVHATGLLEGDGGVYVGGWNHPDHPEAKNRCAQHYLRHNGPEHILAFAPSGSGKGVGLVIPTLESWGESAVVYDIKGENWAATAGFRAQQGHICFKFSPVEEGASSRFNPLAEIRLHSPRDVSDAQNLAELITHTGESAPDHQYWEDAAASIVTGMILHVCYAADLENRRASLADLAYIFDDPKLPFDDRLAGLLNYEHDPTGARRWKMPDGTLTKTHPTVRLKVRQMLNKEPKEFGSVLSTATTALAVFADPLVAAATAASDFRITDLVDHEKPISLYIVVPPSDTKRLRPLVRILFTVIVNRLCEKLVFAGSRQVQHKHRLLFLIDEFPSLKRMDLFADLLSYMRGFGLKAYLIAQDIEQIIQEYGQHQSLVGNCDIRVAYTPNNYPTAEYLSNLAGTRTIERSTASYSGARSSPVMHTVSTAVDVTHRPLLTPDEIMRIRPARKIRDDNVDRIVEAGDMLIFIVGHYPIYGRQMLYFFDPILNERAAISPPTQMIRILPDATIADQLPLDKTEHALSPVEPVLQVPATKKRRPQPEQRPLNLELPKETKDDFWY